MNIGSDRAMGHAIEFVLQGFATSFLIDDAPGYLTYMCLSSSTPAPEDIWAAGNNIALACARIAEPMPGGKDHFQWLCYDRRDPAPFHSVSYRKRSRRPLKAPPPRVPELEAKHTLRWLPGFALYCLMTTIRGKPSDSVDPEVLERALRLVANRLGVVPPRAPTSAEVALARRGLIPADPLDPGRK